MKNAFQVFLFFSVIKFQAACGQTAAIDKMQFFNDTSVLNATISTDLNSIFHKKGKEGQQYAANFSTTLPDGSSVNEPIMLELRGHFRKSYCYVPPLRIIFKSKKNSVMRPLGSLKLVSECRLTGTDQDYLLKEFLVYKMYNLLTDMSFRVRLVNLSLVDSVNKKRSITEHAFLMEDVKNLAERNNCADMKKIKIGMEATDRRQMTMVAIFEYMIGNTDWSVPGNHNVKLIMSTTDSLHRPYAIPYDFDYSGFVNTDYAVPDEQLSIASVRERLYRGFPRTIDELNEVLDIFKKQKGAIYTLIGNFGLLTLKNKKDLYQYLDDFFDLISNPDMVNDVFIRNSRTE